MNKIPQFLLPPVFPGDEDKTRRASLLQVILLAFLTALLIYSLFTPLPVNMYIDHWLYVSPIIAILTGMLLLNRRGYVKLASSITVLALIGILIPASISTGGVRGLAYAGFILVVLCAGLLISETAGILTALASILAGLVFTYLETTGVIPVFVSQRIPVMVVWGANAMFLFMSAVVLTLAVRNINRAMQRSRRELEERTRAEESLRQSETELRQYTTRLETLRQIDQDILAAQSPDTIARAALGRIRQLIPCHHADISLIDLKAGSATVLAIDTDGSSPVRPGTRMSLAPYQGLMSIAGRQKAIQFREPGELPQGYFEGIVQSGMVVPFFNGEELIGALSLWSVERGGFKDWQVDIASDVTDLIAIAIQHARLNQATQRQLQELTILYNIALADMEASDEDSLIQRVVEIIGDILFPDLLVVLLVDEASQELYHHPASRGPTQQVLKMRIPLGTGIIGHVAASGQPRRIGDVSQDPDYLPANPDIRSELTVPIKAGERVLGVINVESIRADAFSEADERLLVTFSGQLAAALQRMRADEAMRRLNLDLEKRVAERTNELEDKARELETFAYSVSHDLKAPLRGIDGYSHLLLDEHSASLNEEGRSFLNTIRRATDQMNQLINDLLDYSRVERRNMVMAGVNMDNVIQSLLNERKDELESRLVTVTVQMECSEVYAEPEGLAQAMRNLIDNALKFSREVDKPVIEIGSRHEGKGCVVWVRDNGIGFNLQYHDRIFEIFQRLHRAEDYPGTGIGLALVSKVMKRMGGRAWAESTPGQGSTFYLEFPGGIPA